MKSYHYLFLLLFGIAFQPVLGQNTLSRHYLSEEPFDHWVDSLMKNMSPRERIGQLFHVAAYSNRDETHVQELAGLVHDYGIGGLIFFQGGPDRQAKMCNELQAGSKIPMMISMDAEWGIGMRLDSTTSFPYQMALGAIQDNAIIYQMGNEIARQFHRLGMQVNFAPVVDVNNNPANPVISYRAFGENKYEVAAKGLAYMKGMQDAGIMATAKHFPGHGDTDTDSHYDLPLISHPRERLDSLELFPFESLIKAGLGATMVAHLNIPALDSTGLPSTLSPDVVQQLLGEELNFRGMVFTDALNMKAVSERYEPGMLDLKALQAGNDGLLFPEDVPAAVAAIEKAVSDGVLSQEYIDQKCRKVLQAKEWLGLAHYTNINRENLFFDLNTPNTNFLNRLLVEQSLTVLGGAGQIIPVHQLTNRRMLSLSVTNGVGETDFQNMLGQFMPMDHLQLSPDADERTCNQIRDQISEGNYEQLIVGLHQLLSRPRNRPEYSKPVVSLIQELIQKNTILVHFRNPYILDHFFGIEQCPSIVVAYQGGELQQELSAQLIFGAIGASGRLPVTVNQFFSAGSGVDIEPLGRLKYTVPEEVGWDSQWLEAKIDSICTVGLDSAAYPGCQVLVAKEGRIVFHKSYGYHTYEKQRAIQNDDLFDFASVTKVTGPLPALMQLVDDAKFNLDTTMEAYWPDFVGSNKEGMIWREVLAHQAKLKAWIPYWKKTTRWWNRNKFKPGIYSSDSSALYPVKVGPELYLNAGYRQEMYKAIRKSKLLKEPTYLYSGLSFYLYPEIISQMTGEDYEDYCKNQIYRPLGANTLTWNPWKDYPLSRIVPTERDTFFRKEQIHGYVHDEGAAMMGGVSGNAGLFGTANDLAKLMQMYMNMGEYGGERLVSEKTLKDFTSYQYPENNNRRGLGFDKPLLENRENGYSAPSASDASFGHSGYTGTFTWADPEEELVLVFFSNRVYPTRLNTKLYSLGIRPALHEVLYNVKSN